MKEARNELERQYLQAEIRLLNAQAHERELAGDLLRERIKGQSIANTLEIQKIKFATLKVEKRGWFK